MLSNADIAELLAQQAEREAGILSRAFRRAARSAFLWPDNIVDLLAQNRSLTELRGIGPFIERQICHWIEKPPRLSKRIPEIRRDFISLADARRLLAAKPAWRKRLRGDLQMHNPLERETRRSIFDTSKPIDRSSPCDREHYHNQRRAA